MFSANLKLFSKAKIFFLNGTPRRGKGREGEKRGRGEGEGGMVAEVGIASSYNA